MTAAETLEKATEQAFEAENTGEAKQLYERLMRDPGLDEVRDAREFLYEQLAAIGERVGDLPEDPAALEAWISANAANVARQYADYLEARRAGAPRRFFSNKAHALYFLQCVAPTKLVDGAWLFGLLKYCDDYRFDGLIRTYLEELGDGDPAQNHVVLYRKLLAEQGCDPHVELQDSHYLQGVLQLALGYNADYFLPEVIGYNLGYEQLPLHLLISSFELVELGIDPYYFTLHVTIDNASTGHARKAAQSVLQLMPVDSNPGEFYRRISLGYRLNDLGLNTMAVIESFDLHRELIDMLERKRSFGQHMHSDYCKFEGRTVNEWLTEPGKIQSFLIALENKGWIKRHQDPELSRFWQLIHGAGASMFGVFSPYEKQLLHDWIAGEWRADTVVAAGRRPVSKAQISARSPVEIADPDTVSLRAELKRCAGHERIACLIARMSPGRHSTPAGLLATRLFAELIGQ